METIGNNAWEIIPKISTPLAFAAFVAMLIAIAHARRSKDLLKMLQVDPGAAAMLSGIYLPEKQKLTGNQQFMLIQANQRLTRFRLLALASFGTFVICIVLLVWAWSHEMEVSRRQEQAQEVKIAKDRMAAFALEVQRGKDRFLDSYVVKEKAAHPEFADMAAELRVNGEFTSTYLNISDYCDMAMKRLKELVNTYVESIESQDRIRSNEIKNAIQAEQLDIELRMLMLSTDSRANLTSEIRDSIRNTFKAYEFARDPIPGDPEIQKILAKARDASVVSIKDSEALPSIVTSGPGEKCCVTGKCISLQLGKELNDRSVILLEMNSLNDSERSKCVCWFEWGWGKLLKDKCKLGSLITISGTLSAREAHFAVLETCGIPGESLPPFYYQSPHNGMTALRIAEGKQ